MISGWLCGRAIMSPRLMSRSSASRRVTAIGRVRLLQLGAEQVDADHPRGQSGRQHHDLVADLDRATGHRAGVAAVVVEGVGLRPHDVLHREPHVDQVLVRADVHVLEVVQQRRTLVPGHVVRTLHHVVAAQGRHRDDGEVRDVELRRERAEVVGDLLEPCPVVVDEVHLVDAAARCAGRAASWTGTRDDGSARRRRCARRPGSARGWRWRRR